MKANEIAKRLVEARELYYNSEPVMSDEDFDLLEDELRSKNPDHEYFQTVGAPSVSGEKIAHHFPMLSMGKAKTLEDVEKWLKRLELPEETPLLVEAKIDGLSCDIRYVDGVLQHVSSRGDGKVGQDISHIAKYLSDIPENVSYRGEVFIRGELYLSRTTNLPNPENKPLRNIAVGLVNRKDKNLEDLTHLHFVAYKILGDDSFEFESQKLVSLADNFPNVLTGFISTKLSELEAYYLQYIEKMRESWEYETDGLTITVDPIEYHDILDSRWIVDHHHHYQVAWKPPAEFRKTILNEIEWNLSKHGSLIPVAIFESITIGGARISRAALNNAENIEKMNLAIGDSLIVERSNDVIPYVVESIKSTDKNYSLPADCPSCARRLVREGVHLRCKNEQCPEVQIQKILFWIRQSSIDGVSEQTVRRLWKEGLVKEIGDIYTLKNEQIAPLDGFGEKSAENIITSIERARHMTAVEFIARLGIESVGERSLKKLGIATVDNFLEFNNSEYVIGQRIIEWKQESENLKLINELVKVIDISEEDNAGDRERVAMTGKGPKSRKDLVKDIQSMGYEFVDSVTSDTAILICEDPQGASTKLQKARKLGIKLVSYKEFFNTEGTGSLFV